MIHLMAVLALLQQETEEETFQRLEQSIVRAKSLKAKVRLDMEMGNQKATRTMTVLLKEGNKLRMVATFPDHEGWVVSDGSKVKSDPKTAIVPPTEWETPKVLNERAATVLVRWGCLDLLPIPVRIRDHDSDPKERFKVTDVKFGDLDKDQRTVTYRIKEAEVKLWFDPTGPRLLKRTISVPQKAVVTETYEEFTLNGDIPDADFQPPRK